jgi:ADP-dependent NAD(P)H-hydrate dehydratase / NAD(P)H-hydrate epimerase
MKLFSTRQIASIDQYTIANEPISSCDLMERASMEIYKKITELFFKDTEFVVIAGHGNNGGDGLVVARLLSQANYKVRVLFVTQIEKLSADSKVNFERLKTISSIKYQFVKNSNEIDFHSDEVIIDALFGSGLTRPIEGLALEAVIKMNNSGCKIISIDVPSGLMGEDNSENNQEGVVKATYTLTLQFPKISFFFAENAKFTGKWFVLPIGLHKDIMEKEPSPFFYTEMDTIKNILKKRDPFSHKGNFGHGLLIAGSYGKMGAAVLSARASMRTGLGLLTVHIPECGYEIFQISVPEAMVSIDTCHDFISELPSLKNFNSMGIGPGIGTNPLTLELLRKLIENVSVPMVLDADALNLISENKDMLKLLPVNTIITPHPKEFDRLVGNSESTYERLHKAKQLAEKYKLIIVLKGAHTQIVFPDGKCFFNSTGNPGMATGGSGDVLTGIILGLLAQGYSSTKAALLGVYLHGLSGDISALEKSQESLIASDIVDNIGYAYKLIQKE